MKKNSGEQKETEVLLSRRETKKRGRKEKKIKTDKKKKRKRRGPYTRVLVPSPFLCL